jgi:hypothetical protein
VREAMWCERHCRTIERPEEEACRDFVPLLFEIDPYWKKLDELGKR